MRHFQHPAPPPPLLPQADVYVARDADFDRQWLPQIKGPWVCSCDDIEWPRKTASRSLTAIALAHGVAVIEAHRALADVLTLVRLFDRVRDRQPLEPLIERALRPKTLVRALVSFEQLDLAKTAGFRWEPVRKYWLKKIVLSDAGELPFLVKETTL